MATISIEVIREAIQVFRSTTPAQYAELKALFAKRQPALVSHLAFQDSQWCPNRAPHFSQLGLFVWSTYMHVSRGQLGAVSDEHLNRLLQEQCDEWDGLDGECELRRSEMERSEALKLAPNALAVFIFSQLCKHEDPNPAFVDTSKKALLATVMLLIKVFDQVTPAK